MKYFSLLSILFLLFGITPVKGQQSESPSLSGQVLNSQTGEPVTFAYLHLEELNRTATAHNDGTFLFTNLPAGTYTLTTYRVGYQSTSQQVEISEQQSPELTIQLQPTVLSSEAVRVVSEKDRMVGSGLEHASKKIMGSDLRQDLGTTLAKTMEDVPGLSSRTMGSAPARPVIRGLGGERVLLLQDGERTGDVSAQSADHAVTVDPMAAEQIEIARGPAALKYGSNAIGGVINVVRNQVVTSMPDHLHGTASLQGESVNNGGVGAFQASMPVGSFALQVDGNFRSAGNTKTPLRTLENSDLLSTNDAIGLSYIRPWGYAGLAGSAYYNEYGIPPGPDGGHAEGVNIEMRKYQAEAKSEIFIDKSFINTVDADYSYKNYFHREIESDGAIGTEYGVLTSNASVSARHDSIGAFSGSFGIWGEAKNYAVNGASTPNSDSYSLAVYSIEEADFGPLHLELGARFDHVSTIPLEEDPNSRIGNIRTRTFNGVSSSISAIYNMRNGLYIGTVLMHSFRAPSQEELFSEGPHLASYSYEIGNPDLNPERGFGKELFLRFRGNRINGELTGFHNGFDNYIYPRNTGRPSVRFPSLNEYQFIGADTQLYGAEASLEVQLFPPVAFSGSASYTISRRELTQAEQQVSGQTDSYQPLPMIPPLKGDISLTYGKQTFQSGVRARWAAEQNRTGSFESPTEGYAVFDLFGQYRFEAGGMLHTASMNIENLFDTTYRSHLSRIKDLVPEPGRNISLLYRIYF